MNAKEAARLAASANLGDISKLLDSCMTCIANAAKRGEYSCTLRTRMYSTDAQMLLLIEKLTELGYVVQRVCADYDSRGELRISWRL